MRANHTTRVYVKGTDQMVESSLARTLYNVLGESAVILIGSPETADGGDIVVTTDGACSPAEVSNLSEMGEQVVVLAALPDETAEARYRSAGAMAYLPMVAAVAPLVAAIAASLAALGAG